MKPRPWHPNRPTPKMVKAAFAAQAPLGDDWECAQCVLCGPVRYIHMRCKSPGDCRAQPSRAIGGTDAKRPVLRPNYGDAKTLATIPDDLFFSASSVQPGTRLPKPEPVFPRHKDGIGGTNGGKK